MRAPTAPWPKLLGVALGAAALGLAMSVARPVYWSYGALGHSPDIVTWLVLSASLALLALSFPLYRAHDWARRAVLALGSCLLAAALVLFALLTAEDSRIFHAPEITGWLRIQQAATVVTGVGRAMAILAPQVLILYLLRHREIRAAFQDRPKTI